MSKTVFISYGRDEKNPQHVELVKKVKVDLEQEGFTVLMDYERLEVGAKWELQLEQDIAQSDWILFFITPYSARRPDGYCLNELSFGLSKRKAIAPVMVDFEVPPLSICRIQYLDLQNLKDATYYKNKIQEIISVLNEEKKLGFEGGHTSLLANLEPLKSETIIAKHVHGFIGREWIYEAVNRWLEEDIDSRVLWITAEAGYGKSALSVFLSESHPSSTSIHFCQHNYRESRDPKNMLKVLIYELSTQIPEYHELLLGLNIKDKLHDGSPSHIFRELLVEPLATIERPERDLFFIIDALDEAKESDGNNPIVNLIADCFSDLPQWFNIIITSRPEPELISKLENIEGFNPIELKANEQDNLGDLEVFILSKLKELDSLKVKALVNKSEGNILYLKNTLELSNIKEGNFTLEDIENLPRGMKAFYAEYFKRKFYDEKRYEKKFMDFVNVLVASKEGFFESLLRYILKLKQREYQQIVDEFGSLLEVNDDIISFYHKSLFDWLSDYKSSKNYSADIDDGNKLIAKKLYKCYKEKDQDDVSSYYETYLLQALYKTKSYDKLEKVLKDILFIGRIYNQKKQTVYKEILSLTIENYSHKCDVKPLRIYESFFKEQEHLITRVHDNMWQPSQTLLQLAYEDGNNSPLSLHVDELLGKKKIDFSWLKKRNRREVFTRSGLLSVLQGHTQKVNGSHILSDNRILSFSDDSTLRLWSTKGEPVRVLEGHTQTVRGADILSDNRILSFSSDGTLRLWDDQGELLHVFRGHIAAVKGASILSDNRILSFSEDATLRLWSSQGELLHVLEGHTRAVRGVHELSDGRLLSFSDDATLRLWSNKGEALAVLEGHTKAVKGIYLLSDGTIVSFSNDFTLRLWSNEGEALAVLQGHTSWINGALILNDNKILSFSDDNTLRLWNKKGKLLTTVNEHTEAIKGAYILSDNRILSYANDNTLRLWSAKLKPLSVLEGHIAAIKGVHILNDNRILSYGCDDIVRLWSDQGEALGILEGHKSSVNGINVLDDNRVLSFSNDNTLRVWEFQKEPLAMVEGHTRAIKGIQILDDNRILTCSNDFTLRLWSLEGEPLSVLKKHAKAVKGFKVLKKNKILSFSNDATLRLWSSKGKALAIFEGHTRAIKGVEVLSDDKVLSFATDSTLRLWTAKGKPLAILEGHRSSVNGALILNDNKILSFSADNTLRLWSSKGEPLAILKGHTVSIKGAKVLNDNRILSFSSDNTLRLWSVEGEPLATLEGHTQAVKGVQILSDGRILSFSDDATVRLWSPQGESLAVLQGHTKAVKGVEVLSDNRILSFSDDATLRLWSPQGESLAVLQGHTKAVNGARILSDGTILSFAGDNTLIRWSSKGEKLDLWFLAVESLKINTIDEEFFIANNAKRLLLYDFMDGE